MTPFAAMRLRQPSNWTPLSLPDPRGWYVSDNGANTLNAGELESMADKTGRGNVVSAGGVAGNRATLIAAGLNGRTIRRSDATKKGAFTLAAGDILTATQNASGVTLATLYKTDNTLGTGDGYPLSFTITSSGNIRACIGRGFYASNTFYLGGRRQDLDSFDGANDTANYGGIWKIVIAVIDYSGATARLWVNGVNTATDAAFQLAGLSSNTSANLNVGGFAAVASLSYGDYAEEVVNRGAIGTSDRQKLEGYLAWQWGLQASNLPPAHPYLLAPP